MSDSFILSDEQFVTKIINKKASSIRHKLLDSFNYFTLLFFNQSRLSLNLFLLLPLLKLVYMRWLISLLTYLATQL